jgi:hypothetical protein
VAFPSVDLFARVVADRAAVAVRLDALTIQGGRARLPDSKRATPGAIHSIHHIRAERGACRAEALAKAEAKRALDCLSASEFREENRIGSALKIL